MSPSPKINISAIMNKKNAKNTEEPIKVEETAVLEKPVILEEPIKSEEPTKVEKPAILEESLKVIDPVKVEEEVISKIPHISISSIKTSKSPAEKKEIIEEEIEEKHESKKEELIETLENYTDNQTEKLSNDKTGNINEEIQEKKEENSEKVINNEKEENTQKEESLEEIEAKINKKVDEETKEKFKLSEKELKTDEKEKELFGNYQSDFKEKVVIETIKEKKKAFREKLKEPKTRITLIAGLLILTIGIISGLFVLDPSNHSFEIYKKGILNNMSKINLDKININTNIINDTWVAESINVENKSFGIFTQKKLLGGVNYKYKDVVYKTKLELETVIKDELNNENAAKAAEHARLEAEKARLEAERIKQEKKAQENNIIKNVLLNKFK